MSQEQAILIPDTHASQLTKANVVLDEKDLLCYFKFVSLNNKAIENCKNERSSSSKNIKL